MTVWYLSYTKISLQTPYKKLFKPQMNPKSQKSYSISHLEIVAWNNRINTIFGLLFHREFWRWIRPIVYIPSIVQSSHRVLSEPFCLKALKSWLLFLFFSRWKNFFNNFLAFFIKIFRVRRGSYSLLEIRMKRLDLALKKMDRKLTRSQIF